MATTTLRKLLDFKVWQACAPSPLTNAANMLVANSPGPDQTAYYITGTNVIWAYNPNEDAWYLPPAPSLNPFAAGASANYSLNGPTGTALAGSTSTTLNSATTVLADLGAKNGLSFKVRITGGTGAGQQRGIVSSTYGANAVVTVDTPWNVTPDNTSTYTLYTGRLYMFGGGTLNGASSFKFWDYATQTLSSNLSITGLPATFGTDSKMVIPHSLQGGPAVSGTATGGSATTLVHSGKTWGTNQFANWQVRITAGTGAGQIRQISSNNATTLTINSGTALDNTSVYSIEPNDDHIYLLGNNAVAMYRYSISGNSWTTLSPTAARAAAPGAALSATWVTGVTQSEWNNESSLLNGNRIYSFRGNGLTALDYYDIGQNTWVSGISYGSSNEPFGSGASYTYDGGNYIYIQKEQTLNTPTRIVRLDLRAPSLDAFSTNVFPAPTAATLGDKMWNSVYYDGSGTTLRFIYVLQPGGTQLHRCLIW